MTYPTIEELIPHSGPAVQIDSVLTSDDEAITCRATIGPHTWFADDTGVPAIVCLELMAQTVAAYDGLRNLMSGVDVQRAVLVSCRELDLEVDRLEHGDVVDIEARVVVGGMGALASFTCDVFRRGQRLASGSLNVYEGDQLSGGVGE